MRPYMTSKDILDEAPPRDLDAEQSVLGSILIDPGTLDEVSRQLRPEDFYADANARIYRHLVAMLAANQPIDIALLSDRLRQSGEYDMIGGGAYLGDVLHSVPYARNAGYYAEIVVRLSRYRTLRQIGVELFKEAHAAAIPVEDLLGQVEKGLAEIRTGRYQAEPVSMFDATVAALAEIDAILRRERSAGILTGFPAFDQNIGGVFPGELAIIAARPGQGKTSLGLQWAFHAARRGRRVYFATLEMSHTEIALKNLCAEAGVSSQKVRTGTLGPDDRRKLVEASQCVGVSTLYLHDWPAIRAFDIHRAARRLKAELVVVDYLQIVTPADRSVKRHEQIGEISKALKAMAREMNIPVVAMAQLNRQVDQQGRDTEPRLSHLRESGDIEQDADMVCLLHVPKDGFEGKAGSAYWNQRWDANLIVAKNRKGATSTIRLYWNAPTTRFSCVDGPGSRPSFGEFDQFSSSEGKDE